MTTLTLTGNNCLGLNGSVSQSELTKVINAKSKEEATTFSVWQKIKDWFTGVDREKAYDFLYKMAHTNDLHAAETCAKELRSLAGFRATDIKITLDKTSSAMCFEIAETQVCVLPAVKSQNGKHVLDFNESVSISTAFETTEPNLKSCIKNLIMQQANFDKKSEEFRNATPKTELAASAEYVNKRTELEAAHNEARLKFAQTKSILDDFGNSRAEENTAKRNIHLLKSLETQSNPTTPLTQELIVVLEHLNLLKHVEDTLKTGGNLQNDKKLKEAITEQEAKSSLAHSRIPEYEKKFKENSKAVDTVNSIRKDIDRHSYDIKELEKSSQNFVSSYDTAARMAENSKHELTGCLRHLLKDLPIERVTDLSMCREKTPEGHYTNNYRFYLSSPNTDSSDEYACFSFAVNAWDISDIKLPSDIHCVLPSSKAPVGAGYV